MCTAATYKTKDFYFGRTLDYEFSYGDEITITPRNYIFEFRHMEKLSSHYAIIGMAHVAGDYPLYYDAVNEKGLGMAGLNFVGNAVYNEVENGKENVAQFEFIPWILGKCASVQEAKECLKKINLVKTPFSEMLPCAQLHWIIADKEEAITVESMADGLHGCFSSFPSVQEVLPDICRQERSDRNEEKNIRIIQEKKSLTFSCL